MLREPSGNRGRREMYKLGLAAAYLMGTFWKALLSKPKGWPGGTCSPAWLFLREDTSSSTIGKGLFPPLVRFLLLLVP